MKLDVKAVTLFQEMALNKTEIRLINVYKGLPISYPAIILAVGSERLHIHTEKTQIICLYRDRQTFIRSPYPKIIQAHVLDLNLGRSEAVLSEFTFMDRLGLRASVRVAPRDALGGVIVSGKGEVRINCTLADVSQEGLGLIINENYFSPGIFAAGQEVTVHLAIPQTVDVLTNDSFSRVRTEEVKDRYSREDLRGMPTTQPPSSWLFNKYTSAAREGEPYKIIVKGKVMDASRMPQQKYYHVGVKIMPSDNQRDVIGKFIVQRQVEILNEIKQIYGGLTTVPGEPPAFK